MKTSTKIFSAIGGVLLIIAGIWSLFQPFKAFIAFQYVTGAILIITGILSLAGYFSERKSGNASGWIIFDGIISILCGIIFLFSKYNVGIFAVTVSVTLGMWLLMLGISQCSKSMQLKKLGSGGWGWLTALGIISIICSLCVFIHPISSAIGTEPLLMGFLFIVGGVTLFSNCFAR